MCGSAPSAPQLPQYPSLTPEQQTNLGQQAGISSQFGSTIQGVSGQLGNNQSILQQISGLFNSDGSVNQSALASLQQQSNASSQQAGAVGQSALGSAANQYGVGGGLAATQSAYTNALQNGAPANQQLQFQQNQSFQQLQEQAAQQGIPITGTNFSNAVSNSSAGQKLIQNFQQNANIQNQNYNLGYVNQLAGNMGQLSSAASNTAATGQGLSSYATQTPLNYLQSSVTNGKSALAPLLASYQNQLSSAYSPLYQQQIGPYQQQIAQGQANYQAGLNQYSGFQGMLSNYLTPFATGGGYALGNSTKSSGGVPSFGGGVGGVSGGSEVASGATDLADVG